MKHTIFLLIWLTIAPVGFAQIGRTPTPLITPPPNPSESSSILRGTVTAFVPGKMLTVKTELPNPVSFALSKTVRYIDKHGRQLKPDRIKPGVRVRVYSEGNEDTRTANRVILDQ
jgi:hypothetical protein